MLVAVDSILLRDLLRFVITMHFPEVTIADETLHAADVAVTSRVRSDLDARRVIMLAGPSELDPVPANTVVVDNLSALLDEIRGAVDP
jgi:hypothetical protein